MEKRNEQSPGNEKYPETVEQIEIGRRHAEEIAAEEERRRAAEMAARKKKRRRVRISSAVSKIMWCVGIVVVLVLAYAFAHFYCKAVTVREGSMEPTLSSGDTWLIDSAAYKFGTPKRGDIIVFRSADSVDETDRIKRVIGLPGETVQIKDGKILINGEVYNESGNFPEILDPGIAEEPVTLLDDEYFVLGDNRNGSEDSRYTQVGNVDASEIIGKIWLRVQPLSKFGPLN